MFSRRRRPSPIKYLSLTQALKKVSNIKLAKELAFCVSTDTAYRLATTERYMFAYNAIPLKSWDNIAVVKIGDNLNRFRDIVCVNLDEYTDDFKRTHPLFMRLILSELKQIRRNKI